MQKAFLLVGSLSAAHAKFGDQARHIAIKAIGAPVTSADAVAADWVSNDVCDPAVGIAYNYGVVGGSSKYPKTYYYTAGGQFTGIGIDYYHKEGNTDLTKWIEDGLVVDTHPTYVDTFQEAYRLTTTFRGGDLCADSTYEEDIGDTMIVNKGLASEYQIPMTANDATAAGDWTQGSCVPGMGTHWWRDTTANHMTWKSANLFPIVVMYDEVRTGDLVAFFFAAPNGQGEEHSYNLDLSKGLGPALGPYFGNGKDTWGFNMPTLNYNVGPTVCGNLCEQCDFVDDFNDYWNIMHVYLIDKVGDNYDDLTCPLPMQTNGVSCPQKRPDHDDIGQSVTSVFLLFQDQPITVEAAVAAGWAKSGECNPFLGIPYTKAGEGPTVRNPITYWMNMNDELAGMGMAYYRLPAQYGMPPSYVQQNMIDKGLMKPMDEEGVQFQMDISFRLPNDLCVPHPFSVKGAFKLGYQMMINQDTIKMNLPISMGLAAARGWIKGSCSARMGEHWFWDVEETNPGVPTKEMTWKSENVMPIVMMYDEIGDVNFNGVGGVTGFFWAAPGGQAQHGNFGQAYYDCNQYGICQSDQEWSWNFPWNTIRNPNTPQFPSVCGNQCNTYCDFPDMPGKNWQVNHILLNDYNRVTCSGFSRDGGSTCADDYENSPENDPRSVTGMNMLGELTHTFRLRDDLMDATQEKLALATGDMTCDHSSDCAGLGYCSSNSGTCKSLVSVGGYCNVVQKCNSFGNCEGQICVESCK